MESTPPASPPPPALEALAGATDGQVERRFYRSSEVERGARPEFDWNLDAADLDSARIARLVFDAYVDRDGRIVACRILVPEDLAEALRERLETRLRETPMQAAVRLGASAPSVQRIELSVLSLPP